MASIHKHQGRLYLLARLPIKDGSPGKKQYKIALQLPDEPRHYRHAEKRLAQLEKEIKNGSFDWANWTPQTDLRMAGVSWQAAIRMLYEHKCILGKTKESTWEVNYMSRFKRLPMNKQVTTAGLAEVINWYERDTYSYKLMFYLMKSISELSGVPFPKIGRPLHTQNSSKVKDVPSDSEIIEWVESAGEPYRWFFGMMAAYGLRPHEVERCDQIDDGLIQVWDKTKTGYRTVIPMHEDWPALFKLDQVAARPPSIRDDQRPDVCAVWLNARRLKLGIEWNNYSLRHAYAHRLWREGGSQLDVMTAARLMGHSVSEHLKTYRAAIDPNQIAIHAREAIQRNFESKRASLARQYGTHADTQSAPDGVDR